jgi:hypothetical protein
VFPEHTFKDPFEFDFKVKSSPYAAKPVITKQNWKMKECPRKSIRKADIQAIEDRLLNTYQQESVRGRLLLLVHVAGVLNCLFTTQTRNSLSTEQHATLEDVMKTHKRIENKDYATDLNVLLTPDYVLDDVNFPIINQGSTINPLTNTNLTVDEGVLLHPFSYPCSNVPLDNYLPKKKDHELTPADKYAPHLLNKTKSKRMSFSYDSKESKTKIHQGKMRALSRTRG